MEFIGIHVHKKESQGCILAGEGAVMEERIHAVERWQTPQGLSSAQTSDASPGIIRRPPSWS